MLCDAPARKPRTHASHTAPPLPGRDHSRSPSTRVHVCLPRAPLTVVAHDSGPDRRVTALYETMFGSTSTCSSRAFQRYHSQVRQPPPWLSTFESGVRNQVRPPFSPPPFALTAAQPSPPAPPYVCRVQPKHPCIAPRAQPARAVPVPRPRRVNHVARRSNELDVEKVQPAAFTCGRKIGLPAGMARHYGVKIIPHGSHRSRA